MRVFNWCLRDIKTDVVTVFNPDCSFDCDADYVLDCKQGTNGDCYIMTLTDDDLLASEITPITDQNIITKILHLMATRSYKYFTFNLWLPGSEADFGEYDVTDEIDKYNELRLALTNWLDTCHMGYKLEYQHCADLYRLMTEYMRDNYIDHVTEDNYTPGTLILGMIQQEASEASDNSEQLSP